MELYDFDAEGSTAADARNNLRREISEAIRNERLAFPLSTSQLPVAYHVGIQLGKKKAYVFGEAALDYETARFFALSQAGLDQKSFDAARHKIIVLAHTVYQSNGSGQIVPVDRHTLLDLL